MADGGGAKAGKGRQKKSSNRSKIPSSSSSSSSSDSPRGRSRRQSGSAPGSGNAAGKDSKTRRNSVRKEASVRRGGRKQESVSKGKRKAKVKGIDELSSDYNESEEAPDGDGDYEGVVEAKSTTKQAGNGGRRGCRRATPDGKQVVDRLCHCPRQRIFARSWGADCLAVGVALSRLPASARCGHVCLDAT